MKSIAGIRTLAAFLLLAAGAAADDWPQWRGPKHDGVSAEKNWLDAWPAGGPPIAWTANVGLGFSSVVVSGGRAYTIGFSNDKDTVHCLDAEKGTSIWSHSYPSELGDKYFEGGTTPTPTVDGDRVFSTSRWGDVFCFEAATGKVVWKINLQKDAGFPIPTWGFGGSPLTHDKLLVLNVGDAGVALDKATGKIAWKSAAKEPGYSTPLPFKKGDATLLLFSSSKSYLAVDALTGREAWRFKWVTQYDVNAADPIVDGETAFISTGYGKGGVLLKLGAAEPQVAWQNKALRTQMNPAVLIDGHLYAVDGDTTEKTNLKCVEIATGTVKWAQPVTGSGAVSAADGKLLVLTGDGDLIVAPASPAGFAPTGRFKVIKGKFWTAPVLANGRIYCRASEGPLICVDVRKK